MCTGCRPCTCGTGRHGAACWGPRDVCPQPCTCSRQSGRRGSSGSSAPCTAGSQCCSSCSLARTAPVGDGQIGRQSLIDRLFGLVVRRLPRERKIPSSNPACAGSFSGSSHTSDLKIGTPVATLPGAWRYRVSAGTGRPGVSIL